MAKKVLKQRIQRVYKPIDWTLNLVVRGGSTGQQHDVDNDLYYPDREVTPTLIEPEFIIIDKDLNTSYTANEYFTNIKWEQSQNGIVTPCNSPDYDVFTAAIDDIKKGGIIVNKNVPYLSPITLIFSAEYYDPNRKRTLTLKAQIPLSTIAVASLMLYTKLDVPNCVICDPFELENNKLEVITPSYQLGNNLLTDKSLVKGWWYSVTNGTETLIDTEEDLVFESLLNDVLTVRKDWVDDILLRFKSALFPDGNFTDVPPSNCNVNDVRFIRKYPSSITHTMETTGGGIVSGDAKEIIGRVTTSGAKGVINNSDDYFTFIWKMKSTEAGATNVEVARGSGPVNLPFTVNTSDITVEVYEKGPLAAVTQNGSVIIQDGNAISYQLDGTQ